MSERWQLGLVVPNKNKIILDACCGGRMFWFDRDNENAVFCDNREYSGELCDGRHFEVRPDVVADFRSLPFMDETFWHVVFDPPHIQNAGQGSIIETKYGCLPKDWKPYIKAGFDECWRVLKRNGTLVFKWSEYRITAAEVIKVIGREPLYGQKRRKKATTWLVFVKVEGGR
jgi:ubiquinone/menaquinone biosynthesis C-methylase UbiE